MQIADIRYRGPFSYRHLRFFALLAMTFSQLAQIFHFINNITLSVAGEAFFIDLGWAFWGRLGSITFPMLLVASFANILKQRENMVRILIQNLILAVSISALLLVVMYNLEGIVRWLLPRIVDDLMDIPGVMETISAKLAEMQEFLTSMNADQLMELAASPDAQAAMESLGISEVTGLVGLLSGSASGLQGLIDTFLSPDMFPMLIEYGSSYLAQNLLPAYTNLNVALDLFLCTAFFFFTCYKPQNVRGGKLVLFRACAALPTLYIGVSVVMTALLRQHLIEVPVFCNAFLTNRQMPAFVLFFLLVLFFKYREEAFLERGGTQEEYLASLSTNRNSLHLSLYLSLLLAAISLADFGFSFLPSLAGWGLGVSYNMYLAIPFILLFSYNRRTRFVWMDGFMAVQLVLHYVLIFGVVLALIQMIPEFLEFML